MKRLALFAGLVLSASVPAFASGMDSPPWVPAADERAFVAPGDAESDALLDCYGSPERDDSDPDAPHLGPPRITVSATFGLILRADYAPRKWSDPGVHRMMCWRHGSMAEMHLVVPPLYPPGTLKADAATESAIAGWRARRKAAKTAAMTARTFAPPDAATKQLLEGIWLVGAKLDKGTCLSKASGYETQIEFEFRKSGGRVLTFEPPDLFTAIQISGIERSGAELVTQARARDGRLQEFMHIRPLAADRLELVSASGANSQIAYKCGEPVASVTSGVSLERLSTIAPPISGSMTLLAQMPGVSDDDLCSNRNIPRDAESKRRFLQFELYGPVHYWLFGWPWPGHKFSFDFVRSVEDRGDNGMVLHMQEHLDKGPGWDVEAARGKTYDLTILPRGDHIEIPELATTFVRCKPTDLAGAGMSRW